VARKGKGFTRRRIITIVVGVILLIFLANVVVSGGQNLFLADPFAGGLDFRDRELQYSLFALADVNELRTLVAGTDQQIRDYKCFLKLHTSAEITGGRIIPLDSAFQTFGALTPFGLLTTGGVTIDEFRNIELRMRCDSIPKKDGSGQHEFEIKPRPFSPLTLSIWGYNQQGQLVQLKGIDLKPAFEIGGLAYTFNSQVDFIVNPTGDQLNRFGTIKFANEPSVQDPLKPCCPPINGLFTTSERTISKPVRISASFLEDAIEKSTVLAPKTFTTELQFRLAGSFDIDFPDLRDAGVLDIRQIPIDQFLLVTKMNVQVTERENSGFNLFPDQETAITKVEPVDKDGDFVTDGSSTRKTLRVFVTLDDYDRATEGSVKGTIIGRFDLDGNLIATTGLGCGFPIRVDGVQSNFLCNFNILQNTNVGEYTINIDTNGIDRKNAIKSFLLIREGSPVGGDDGCPDKYVRNAFGQCELFGKTGTGTGGFLLCPTGTFRSGDECITPTGGEGGGEIEPCPIQGETRTTIGGICRPTTGTGGIGTKTCVDCQMNFVRSVASEDICPKFQCDDGTIGGGDENAIMNCPDNLPADVLPDGTQTCERVVGFLGGLLPILIDCEGEGRTANIERGEICAPAFVIGIFENLPLLIGIVIVLIIFIAILGAILKRSPAGRALGAVRGFTS